MPAAPPVSFFIPRIPNPSETFILAQIEGLLERGAPVEVVALAGGNELDALSATWGDKLKTRVVPLPKTLGARILAAPGALLRRPDLTPFDYFRFGDDAASLRLPVAALRWPEEVPQRRVWLAHYGRWGRFACALRELGLIQGPIATVFHGRDMSSYLRKRRNPYATLFKRGDMFLPISEFWREKLLRMGAPEGRTLVHRMGVDLTRFSAVARTLAPGEPVRFVGVGRMVEKKGFDDAIAAFAAMRAGGPAATLTLIGDGALRAALQRQAAQLNLGEAVRFTGMLAHADVAEELARAHVFVLPSRTSRSGDMEGIPVALMEAMAQGMPVLATRHSGTPELVQHDVSGLLCDEGDRAGLAANMGAMARAPERWAAMGVAGAARVRAAFDVRLWNDRLLQRLSLLYAEAPMTSGAARANQGP